MLTDDHISDVLSPVRRYHVEKYDEYWIFEINKSYLFCRIIDVNNIGTVRIEQNNVSKESLSDKTGLQTKKQWFLKHEYHAIINYHTNR